VTGPGADVGPVVRLVDERPNGLARLLAGLFDSNLARDPRRSRLLGPVAVEIEATDAGVAATVKMGAGVVEISNGPANPGADLSVHAASGDLLDLAAAPLWLGVPAPSSREGRAILRGVAAGRVRIRGMLRHPVRLSRFGRLLSAR
jgi:hypothetical protein